MALIHQAALVVAETTDSSTGNIARYVMCSCGLVFFQGEVTVPFKALIDHIAAENG